MNQKECSYRSLPWASELVWFPITVTTAFLHYITYPLGLEKLISGLVVGGFFGMILIPISLCGGIVYLLENSHILPPNFVWIAAQLLAIPFSIYYVVSILILNRQHLSVKDANCHPTNRNFIESASSKFLFSFQDYLQMTCVPWSSDAKLLPNKQYVIAVHPHGIHCTPLALFSTVGSSFDMRFPNLVGQKLTGLAATIMFKIPLVRELFLNMGYVDASRCVASKVLEEGRSLYVCTGGEEESMYTTPGKDTVVLKRRKGFVRLALSYGAELVPVFGVGNNDLYTVRFIMSFLHSIYLLLVRFSLIFYGCLIYFSIIGLLTFDITICRLINFFWDPDFGSKRILGLPFHCFMGVGVHRFHTNDKYEY